MVIKRQKETLHRKWVLRYEFYTKRVLHIKIKVNTNYIKKQLFF